MLGRDVLNICIDTPELQINNGRLIIFEDASAIQENPIVIAKLELPPTLLFSHKGGHEMSLHNSSIIERHSRKKRAPTQYQVMKSSAIKAFSKFYECNSKIFSAELDATFALSLDKGSIYPFFRPEWCHVYAHSLSPLWFNPQRASNLGAAPYWANSAMLLSEQYAYCMAQTQPEKKSEQISIFIKPQFEVFQATSLARNIYFSTRLQSNSTQFLTYQCINPLQPPLLFHQASDSVVLSSIAVAVMNHRPPCNVLKMS